MPSQLCRWPAQWSVFLQSQMGPVEMVVTNVFREQAFQVTLVQRNYVIQQVSTAASHPTFCHSVLPRAAERSSDHFKSNRIHRVTHRFAELGVASKIKYLCRES